MLGQVDVLWVVELGIGGVEDGMDHPGLQVQQHSPGDVMLIVCLSKGKPGLAQGARMSQVPNSGFGRPSLKTAILFPSAQ